MRVEAEKLTLTEDGSTKSLVYSEPFGAGLNGHIYIGKPSSKRDLLLQTKFLMYSRVGHYWEPEIRIFRNRGCFGSVSARGPTGSKRNPTVTERSRERLYLRE